MTFKLRRAGSIVGVDRFPSPLDDPGSPLSQLVKQPMMLVFFANSSRRLERFDLAAQHRLGLEIQPRFGAQGRVAAAFVVGR